MAMTPNECRVNGRTFKEWKAKVDKFIEDETGLSTDDLPDYGFYVAYENAVSPELAAKECLEDAKEEEYYREEYFRYAEQRRMD